MTGSLDHHLLHAAARLLDCIEDVGSLLAVLWSRLYSLDYASFVRLSTPFCFSLPFPTAPAWTKDARRALGMEEVRNDKCRIRMDSENSKKPNVVAPRVFRERTTEYTWFPEAR